MKEDFSFEEIVGEGHRWLLENEDVDSDAVKNALYVNIFCTSRWIKDLELVGSKRDKALLIWVSLRLLGKFKKSKIEQDIIDKVHQGLPNFRVRVVYDYSIMEKALKILEARVESSENLASDIYRLGDGTSPETDKSMGS